MAQKGQIAPVRYRKAASGWPPRVLPHVTGVACGEVVSPSSHCASAGHDATCFDAAGDLTGLFSMLMSLESTFSLNYLLLFSHSSYRNPPPKELKLVGKST